MCAGGRTRATLIRGTDSSDILTEVSVTGGVGIGNECYGFVYVVFL